MELNKKVKVLVKPGSKKGPLLINSDLDTIQNYGAEFIIYLKSRAVDGKANAELIEVMATHFNVSKKDVTILSGQKSRIKIVGIINI